MALLPSERAAVTAFCERVRAMFGARVIELSLFGSRARGDGDEDSDIDVVVVVEGLSGPEAREIAHIAGDMMTEHDVLVAPFAVSRERMDELRMRERTIALEIARDRVPL